MFCLLSNKTCLAVIKVISDYFGQTKTHGCFWFLNNLQMSNSLRINIIFLEKYLKDEKIILIYHACHNCMKKYIRHSTNVLKVKKILSESRNILFLTS